MTDYFVDGNVITKIDSQEVTAHDIVHLLAEKDNRIAQLEARIQKAKVHAELIDETECSKDAWFHTTMALEALEVSDG